MKSLKAIKSFVRKNSYFCFVYTPILLLLFLIFMLLLANPDIASEGMRGGIYICLKTLLPSIFPFMFFSSLLMNLSVSDVVFEKASAVTRFVFDLPGVALPIIIMSLIGGYPVGAFLIKDAFEKGKITSMQGKRMLLFCVNPGIGFTYSLIGCSMYGSFKIGIILFAVSVVSSFVIGILSRFYDYGENYSKYESAERNSNTISESLIRSMSASVNNTVNVCVWVVAFSCFSDLVNILPIEKTVSDVIKMISEVTNGVIISKNEYSIYVLSAVVGFCGFCIHMQIMPSLSILKLKYSHFFCSRILGGSLNCIFTYLIFRFLSIEIDVAAIGYMPKKTDIHSSAAVCVFLMIMCGLFVLGDGFTACFKEKKKSSNKGNKIDLY